MLGRRARRDAAYVSRFSAPIKPEAPFFAIGDIHGCFDQIQRAIARIDAEHPSSTILCVGDFVDRGEQSAEVLTYLHGLQAERGARLICLMGNHEEMLLKFLDDPEARGPGWMRHGGLQTLASYRVALDRSDFTVTRDALAEAMGPTLVAWLRALPTSWHSGNVWAVHAGADPALPMEHQGRDTLLWGHRDFGRVARSDGQWVLHGHTIRDAPQVEAGVISIDTGAYATGRLTVAHIQAGDVEFFMA
ncbi:Serine/threonine protein phosphatase [Candidatus Rhodobacter oscarellae]|uniref:Serine/threonine protein phosphatase n=1 Tax=Candidatus Rhodobacter oscarellae TaxID=1675527 RepID=A0A0J9E7W2_9RHOB|nr:Serine/threonine protein phosphatase [Candidatus Rhodobacter lobularis]